MAGEVGTQVRDLLSANEAHLLEPWVAAAAGPARARVAPDELRRNCRGLLRALTAAVEEGELDVRAEPYAGVRAGLTEMSRERARRGFTPSQTAAEVLSLKKALFALIPSDEHHLELVAAVSGWVDALRLLIFESFVGVVHYTSDIRAGLDARHCLGHHRPCQRCCGPTPVAHHDLRARRRRRLHLKAERSRPPRRRAAGDLLPLPGVRDGRAAPCSPEAAWRGGSLPGSGYWMLTLSTAMVFEWFR
jgi:hypothetical protein